VKVLIACEESGRVRDAFLALGHDAISCDLEDTRSPGPHYKGDVRDILGDGWDLMIAHPECTRLTNAGVRWLINAPPPGRTFPEMWTSLFDAAEFYRALRDAPIPRKAIENPIMHKYARDLCRPGPRQVVQPWWFGEEAFKATGLELINLPPLVPTNKLTPPKPGTEEHKNWSFIHRMTPGPNRKRDRSVTFQGIAEAMAMQWGGDIRMKVAA
jgi:hypothetical protein